jgi:ribonuclease P protein component
VLAPAQRLRTAADFRSVVRKGARAGSATLVVHLLADADSDASTNAEARAGFLVGKSVGNAVTRNRVQRRLRHLVRPRLSSVPAGSSVVVRALPGAAVANSTQLAAALDGCLRRLTGVARRGRR